MLQETKYQELMPDPFDRICGKQSVHLKKISEKSVKKLTLPLSRKECFKLKIGGLRFTYGNGLVQFREENGEFALATLSRYYHYDD